MSSVCIGSSVPPKRFRDFRAARAMHETFPSFRVRKVSTRSDSRTSTTRTRSASLRTSLGLLPFTSLRELRRDVASARLEHDREREREKDQEQHERDRDA